MKIYSTKYALTNGIMEHEVSEHDVFFGLGMIIIDSWTSLHGEGKDWHRSESAAAARAEALAVNKIASLKKQIARLEAFAETMRAIK